MRHQFSLLLSMTLSLTIAAKLVCAEAGSAPSAQKAKNAAAVNRDSRYPVLTDFEFAYIDKTGNVSITGPFAMAHSFSQGVAVVNEKHYEWYGDHWTAPVHSTAGLKDTILDTKDKIVNKIALDSIEPFRDQYTVAQQRNLANSSFVLVDTHGATTPIQKCIKATNFAEGLFAIRSNDDAKAAGGFGYMDKTGTLVIPHKYGFAGPFSEGLAAVTLVPNGLEPKAIIPAPKKGQRPDLYPFCYIDKEGKKVINGPFQDAGEFKGGLAGVRLNDKWGFIDKEGKSAVPCQYDWVGRFSGPLAPAERNGLVGFIDKSGKEVIPFKFKYAESFGEDLAPATTDGVHWGYIDATGAFKIEPTFLRAHPFADGLALVDIKPRTDIGTHPGEAEYFYKTAKKFREDGELNEAVRYCDTVIKLAPQSDWGKRAANLKLVALPDHFIPQDLLDLLLRGTTYAEKHDFEPAAKIFQECLDKDPGFLQASGSLGYALISLKKYDEAYKVLSATVAKYPNYARGNFRLAQAYEGQGKFAEAQTTLDKAKSLAPDDLLFQLYEITPTPK